MERVEEARGGGVNSGECKPSKDFLRHIANRVIAEYASKLPSSTVEEIRRMLGEAEDRFKFTIYGGDPYRLIAFFDSEEWRNLVVYAKNTHSEELLKAILARLGEEYSSECSVVAERAAEEAERIEKNLVERASEELSPERIARRLKLMGYRVDVGEDGAISVDDGVIKVRIKVESGVLKYVLCREASAKTLDGVLAKMEKIREI